MSHAYRLVSGEPWAIWPEVVDSYLAILERHHVARTLEGDDAEPLAVNPRGAQGFKAIHKSETRDGVRVIPVKGPIFRYSTLMHDYCGGASVQSIAAELQAAMDDPHVRAVLFDVDSPGGEAKGIGELAGLIQTASQRKKVAAYCGGVACSAAYWLFSACPECACSPDATLGSIGAVLQVDTSKPKNVKVYKSEQSPLKWADPDSDEGSAELQCRVNDLAALFVGNVAKYRGVSPEAVLADFGKGGVLIGHKAVAMGMADACSDFETCLGRLSRGERACDAPVPKAVVAPSPPAKGMTSRGKTVENPIDAIKAWFKTPEGAKTVAGVVADAKTDGAADVTEAVTDVAAGKGAVGTAVDLEEKIRAQVMAELQSANLKALETSFRTAAESWFDGLVASGKAIPANKTATVAQHTEAAVLDATKPLTVTDATGTVKTVSRVATVVASVVPPAANKTVPTVATTPAAVAAVAAAAGLTTLAGSPDESEDAASAARKKEMLAATPAGKAALAESGAK